MKHQCPSLLQEDICRIPCGVVRQRQDMIRHLQSVHAAGGETKGMRLQDLIYKVQEVPALYPKYEDMCFEERMNSLVVDNVQIVPGDHHQLQMIALAGFFYNGSTLTCYHCGCSAIDWQTGDDPWIRHAELQPNCPVIRRRVRMHQETGGPSYTIFRRSVSCPEAAVCGNITDESIPVTELESPDEVSLIAVTA